MEYKYGTLEEPCPKRQYTAGHNIPLTTCVSDAYLVVICDGHNLQVVEQGQENDVQGLYLD
eukprot:5806780-Amphidinium_carterae.1